MAGNIMLRQEPHNEWKTRDILHGGQQPRSISMSHSPLYALLEANIRTADAGEKERAYAELERITAEIVHQIKYPHEQKLEESMSVAHSVLIPLMPKIEDGRFSSESGLVAYVMRAAFNKLIDRARKRRRRGLPLEPDSEGVGLVEPAGSGPGPGTKLIAREQQEQILDGLSRGISANDQLLVRLRVCEGRTWAEVGEALDITPVNARVRFLRRCKELADQCRAASPAPAES